MRQPENDKRIPLANFDVVAEASKIVLALDQPGSLREKLSRTLRRANERFDFQDGLFLGGLAALEIAAIAYNL